MNPNYGENQQHPSEEPNLFGAMSSIGFQIYGYVLAQNAGRAASNYERMAKHSDKLDDVFLHMNIPFTGRFDKGGFGSISKAYNGLKASNDVISSGFRYNNYKFISQLSDVGFSKEEVNVLKDFSKLRNKSKYFSDYNGVNNFVGEGDNLINSLLNSKKFKKKSPVNIEQVQNILNKTDESGELLIKKLSPNISQTSTKGVGFAFNLTKFAEKMPTFSKYLFAGARVAAGVADGLIIYDLVKTTGEIAINTYKNTDSYKDKEDRKFMAINHIKSYDQMASFEDRVLSSRISSNQTIQEERSLIQTALNAKSNVNEVLRQSIGGYSVNELSVNKVRKSGR